MNGNESYKPPQAKLEVKPSKEELEAFDKVVKSLIPELENLQVLKFKIREAPQSNRAPFEKNKEESKKENDYDNLLIERSNLIQSMKEKYGNELYQTLEKLRKLL